MALFFGSGVAIVTPFKEDGTINYVEYEKLIKFQLENNIDAIVVAGTTGESTTMSDEEQIELIAQTVKFVNKKVPVVAGTGVNDTRHAIKLSQQAEKVGADGLLIITPYYNKTNKAGLVAHFKAIANSVNIPIILYNVPGRTGMKIDLDVYAELVPIKNIIGVKEASGDISYAMEIKRLYGDRFDLYSGNDDIIVPMMSIGGTGVISVLANILPKETHDMVVSFERGDVKKANSEQMRLNGLVHNLFTETNPIPIKAAMKLMKWNVGGYRLPLYEMSPSALAKLKVELEKLKLI